MPVRIRLSLRGCTNRPFYHIVVAPSRFKRGGRHLEQVGSFDPMPNYNNEKLVALNIDRIKYWLSVGAQPTKPVFDILGLAGVLSVHPRTYLLAKRRREANAAAATPVEGPPMEGPPAATPVEGPPTETPPAATPVEGPPTEAPLAVTPVEDSPTEAPPAVTPVEGPPTEAPPVETGGEVVEQQESSSS